MNYNNDIGSADCFRESMSKKFNVPVESLRSDELLSVLISSQIEKAREILEKHSLSILVNADYQELIKMVSPKTARTLLVAFELSKRALNEGISIVSTVSCPAETTPYLWEIKDKTKEHFLCLYLNARNQLVHKEVISIGSLSASIVHPREVFHPAIQHTAASIILAHNHPSGDVSPSKDDIELTRRLSKAGEIMGIEIIDHIVISNDDFSSLKERGLM